MTKMITKIKYISGIYPRKSSDLCIHATSTNDSSNYACIFGVADTFGREEEKIKAIMQGRFETLLESQSKWNIDTLTEAVYKEILKINNDIRKIGMDCGNGRLHKNGKRYNPFNLFHRLTTKLTSGELGITEGDNEVTLTDNDTTKPIWAKEPDGELIGATLTLILICDNECRLYHIGDSRLYRLQGVNNKTISNFESPYEVKCLTTDHNLLAEMVEERKLINPRKLIKYSRTLCAYLGMNEAKLNLRLTKKKIELKNGDTLILMTDGFFLPIVMSLARIRANISKGDFYIENWLKEFLYSNVYFHPSMNGESTFFIMDLLDKAKKFGNRTKNSHKHYRDDVAVLIVQLI